MTQLLSSASFFLMARPSKEREIAKVLLLGETGSGKTQFVDLLTNYSEQCDKEFKLEKIHVVSSGESSVDMNSDTVDVQKYECHFDEYSIEVIDTPGFADTRGEQQQRKNKMKILEFIREENNINCLCLLFNGTTSRLNESSQKTMIEIIKMLPSTVIENTVILFTNVTGELQVNVMLMKQIIDKLQFSSSKQMTFAMDNPFSIWKQRNAEKWDENKKKEIKELFEICFKNKLADFCKIVRSLGKIDLDSIIFFCELKDEIDLKIREICSLKKHKEQMLNEHLEHDGINYDKVSAIPTERYNTICSKGYCFSNCHTSCSYSGFWLPFAKYCKLFNTSDHCSKCNHHFAFHRRCKFRYITERVTYDENSITKCTISVDKIREDIETNILMLRTQLLFLFADFHRKSNRSYQELLKEEIKLSHLQNVPAECIADQKETCDEANIIGTFCFTTKTTFQEKVEWALKYVGLKSVKSPEEVDAHIKKISPNCCITKTKNDNCSKLFEHAQSILKNAYHTKGKNE